MADLREMVYKALGLKEDKDLTEEEKKKAAAALADRDTRSMNLSERMQLESLKKEKR